MSQGWRFVLISLFDGVTFSSSTKAETRSNVVVSTVRGMISHTYVYTSWLPYQPVTASGWRFAGSLNVSAVYKLTSSRVTDIHIYMYNADYMWRPEAGSLSPAQLMALRYSSTVTA